MALTRKMLRAMGIEDDKIDQIIEAHVEAVDALKATSEGYKADAEKLPTVQAELDSLKANGGEWQTKYEAEHSAFEAYKAEITAKETEGAKETAYRALLKEAGIDEKRIDTVIRAEKHTFGTLELGEDGKLKTAEELAARVKTDWADFVVKQTTSGANTATPPQNTGGDIDLGSLPIEQYIAARKNMGI